MSLLALLPLMLALGICFIPVLLIRDPDHRRAQDYFVSSQRMRPEVVRNSSIAYGLRIVALGPLFILGASGDLWPGIIAAACFGLGVYLVYILRRSLLAFMDGALSRDQSITIHEFIARHHGSDPRVRLLASILTLFALSGLVVAESLALAAVLKPMLPGNSATVYLLVIGAILLMVLYAVPSGHSGVMHSAQVQLGMLYLGLFGLTAVLLYLHVSAVTPRLPYGTFAIASVTACCAIMLGYRSSKYIDTDPVRRTPRSQASLSARLLSRFGKIFNIGFSVLLILIICLALLGFQAQGPAPIVRDSLGALQTGTRVSAQELATLCLLPLLYPLVDVASWQRLAAMRKETASDAEPSRETVVLRRLFAMCAVESSLGWFLVFLLGSLAVASIGAPGGADALQFFVAQISSKGKQVDLVASPLLLIFVFAAALSTMSALFSASLCTIRYDTLPALWPELAPGQKQVAIETTATRRTLIAGGGLCLAVAAGFFIAESSLDVNFSTSAFLALVLASCCAQLSFVPLVVGAIIGPKRAAVRPAWALMILVAGAAGAAATLTMYLATGAEAWLWGAVPACLGCGLLLFAIAFAQSYRSGLS